MEKQTDNLEIWKYVTEKYSKDNFGDKDYFLNYYEDSLITLQRLTFKMMDLAIKQARKGMIKIEDVEKLGLKYFNKCPDFQEDCIQCKFWKDFDKLKKLGEK